MRTPGRLARPFYRSSRRILIQIKVAEAIRLDQAVRVVNKASDRALRAGTWDSAEGGSGRCPARPTGGIPRHGAGPWVARLARDPETKVIHQRRKHARRQRSP
jgi:hypothetical protein